MNDEFYIGWEDRAPSGLARRIRMSVVGLALCALGFAVLLPAAQRTIGRSVFEWGTVKQFSGVFVSRPYPHLLVPRPSADAPAASGRDAAQPPAYSRYYLVKPFKFGLDAATCARFDAKAVNLEGTLIYRGSQTMIEVRPESIRLAGSPASRSSGDDLETQIPLSRQTLVGEIVDSKCYLGVMNPGALAPHRACAIRCISGGIPPVLLVRRPDGSALYLLLVSAHGEPVNQQVLEWVAEPVEITGDVERHGDWLVLRADPASYRRVAR